MADDTFATGTLATNTFASQQVQEDEESDVLDHFEPRQATLFLVDTTPRMFEEDPQTREIPFMQSLQTYMKNMQMMCGYNRDDWLSLMLFGTTEWDKKPETKNVLTLQKFQKVSLDMLKEIKDKIENHGDDFEKLSCNSTYPLHDALWHASQAFSKVKTVMIARKVVLLTCEDNPIDRDEDERHRIRARVLTFKNLGLDLRVIGLSNNFKQEIFYKDLEIIASDVDPLNYKQLKLDDLEEEIQFPSRTISSILWKIGKDVEVPVSIYTVSTSTKYPETCHINKTTNEALKSFLVYRKKSEDDDFYEDEFEPDRGEFNSKVVSAGGIAKYLQFGDRKIIFDVNELSMMFNNFTKGVETVCFKPLVCDPMYHVEPPKFITFKDTASEKQKEFFSGLVVQCEELNLMAVCRISYRIHTPPKMFYFFPSVQKGGFFVYKMPYEDYVRNLDDILPKCRFLNDRPTQADDEAVAVFTKILKKTKIKFDASLFKNPKLGTQIANIEALALDLEQRILPPDSTLPSEKIKERLAPIMEEYRRIFDIREEDEEEGPAPAKKVKLVDNQEMQLLVKTNRVESLTVPQLREFLKQHKIPASGSKKAQVVDAVYQYFRR